MAEPTTAIEVSSPPSALGRIIAPSDVLTQAIAELAAEHLVVLGRDAGGSETVTLVTHPELSTARVPEDGADA